MIYLFFLLLVLPFSLAVPQREEWEWDISWSWGVTASVSLGSPVSSTATGGATTTVSLSPKPTATEQGIPLRVEVDCLDPSWVPTVDAWMKEEVDRKLKEWWESIPDRTDKNFVSELGKAFGDFTHNLACGVDTEDQCVNPSCKGLFYTLFILFILRVYPNCFIV